ncbi:uroporphyrinogen decarboxylase [Chitinophaga costaii]|uniref:Uroporphyrinogen decarboxylase n=1 Tax=Chitinophaga costaii TaxID=1335309 RepID=A0A1C4D5I9_9BACT|nr:uroporphyrinogen decarboxylase [Chitinophaga costaii]PUZ24467.1 uroporphyrinogen decarboxylase [Chitinophaga costaii]SCC26694.1 uroporphyrinogen decarboxylase [Chitinophaga costaii]
MSALKNNLLLQALRGEKTSRTPVWMMRQAGRFLPDYIKLRDKYSFFERCQTPELATEITVMPVDQVGVDAAILFSDILVVPQAMGLEVQLIEKLGPLLPHPIKTAEDLKRIQVPDVNDRLSYVFEALQLIKKTLNGRVPLIGFAGAPFTILCYMVQGKGSKTFDEAKGFCFQQPAVAHALLQMITDTTIAYLREQIRSGADTVQIFDSWGGLLSPHDFENFSLQYIRQIVAALKDIAPVIVFAKGAWFALEEMAATGASGLGIDWGIKPQLARQMAGSQVTLQGNFDPANLLAPIPEIEKATKRMLQEFGPHRHIANLGHGILPNVPVDHARAFVETIKAYQH